MSRNMCELRHKLRDAKKGVLHGKIKLDLRNYIDTHKNLLKPMQSFFGPKNLSKVVCSRSSAGDLSRPGKGLYLLVLFSIT